MKNVCIRLMVFVFGLVICFTTLSAAASVYIPSKNDISPVLPENYAVAKNMAARIISALMWVGYTIAIGMIIYIGIRYIMASADERSNMKGALVKITIGSLIIASSVTIVNAILNLAKIV